MLPPGVPLAPMSQTFTVSALAQAARLTVPLITVAPRRGGLAGFFGGRELAAPPAVVVPVEGQVPPEGDVGVDVANAVGQALEGRRVRAVPLGVDVARVRARCVVAGRREWEREDRQRAGT